MSRARMSTSIHFATMPHSSASDSMISSTRSQGDTILVSRIPSGSMLASTQITHRIISRTILGEPQNLILSRRLSNRWLIIDDAAESAIAIDVPLVFGGTNGMVSQVQKVFHATGIYMLAVRYEKQPGSESEHRLFTAE